MLATSVVLLAQDQITANACLAEPTPSTTHH